jgi:hypothetical protein
MRSARHLRIERFAALTVRRADGYREEPLALCGE